MPEALTTSDATGSEVYARALAVGGASKAASSLILLPLTLPGKTSVNFKASGTLFTLSEITSGIGTFASSAGSNTIWTMPTMAQLGWTHNPNIPLVVPMQRQGLGTLVTNAAAYRGTGNQAAMLAVIGASPGDTYIRSDAANSIYILGGTGAASVLGNWTGPILSSAPNAPTTLGVVVYDNNLLTQFLPQFHPPVTWVSCGPDAWYLC